MPVKALHFNPPPMTTTKTKADHGRPTEQTPYGVLFTDTAAYADYVEQRRLYDWHVSFLDDLQSLRIDATTAIKRIDDFFETLKPCHGGLKTTQLPRIRACLAGNTEIDLGTQLTALRKSVVDVMRHAPGNVAQTCERPPVAGSRPYDGPFPRASGDHTPAFGYHRTLASGRY